MVCGLTWNHHICCHGGRDGGDANEHEKENDASFVNDPDSYLDDVGGGVDVSSFLDLDPRDPGAYLETNQV